MRRLLNEGVDVNVAAWGPKSHGVTPLHLAAKGGHLKVMDELLERGANIDARTKGACGCAYLPSTMISNMFLLLVHFSYFCSFYWIQGPRFTMQPKRERSGQLDFWLKMGHFCPMISTIQGSIRLSTTVLVSSGHMKN